MALVDREVDRLADRAARVMERRGYVRELDEIAEVLDPGVAASLVEIVYEGRAIGWRKHRVEPADAHAAGAITRLLHELPRRRLLHQLAAHAARKAHQLVLHLGAGPAPEVERLRVAQEFDADLGQDRIGIALDERQTVLGQDLVAGQGPGDVGDRRDGPRRARRALGVPSTRAGTMCGNCLRLCHGDSGRRRRGASMVSAPPSR